MLFVWPCYLLTQRKWLIIIKTTCNLGDQGSIPGWERSPGEGNGNPIQYPCLKKSMGLQRVRHDWVTNTFTYHHQQSQSVLYKFTSVLEKCPNKHIQEYWPHINVGKNSVYLPNLLKSVSSNAISKSGRGWGGQVCFKDNSEHCGYLKLKLNWYLFLETAKK